jgi:formylglycine-generating enzyme required for sulfatase activity
MHSRRLLLALLLTVPACSRPGSGAEVLGKPMPTSSPAAASVSASASAPAITASATSAPAPSPPPPEEPPKAAEAPLPERIDGMILVPAGSFTMGADSGGEPDEWPAHVVTLPAFYLDETEVTNEAYEKCVAAGTCPPPDPQSAPRNGVGSDRRFRHPRQPVSAIAWESARAYCHFVGKRLPTEAEFEKAARGTDGRTYPWGNTPPGRERAVFQSMVTEDVGTHPQGDGPYGHHDLAGNVWEWMEDPYDPFAYRRPSAATGVGGTCAEAEAAYEELRREQKKGFTGSNPIPTECERVLRGGAFNYHATGLRATNRVHHPPRFHLVMAGVRCARDAR